MTYEMPVDQGRLEEDIDRLFEAADRAAFLILCEMVKLVQTQVQLD